MGYFDQYLQILQQGASQKAQRKASKPNVFESFMQGLQSSRANRRADEEFKLKKSDAEWKRKKDESDFDWQTRQRQMQTEESEYERGRRPIAEKMQDLALQQKEFDLQQAMTPQPKKAPTLEYSGPEGYGLQWDGENWVPAVDAQGNRIRKYERPQRISVSGGVGIDKSLIPGTAEWKRVQDVTFREANQKGVVKDIDTVNKMLDNADALIRKAPGSAAGAGASAMASFFGKSTEASRATASLKALQATLMMRMPRLEGPQSDADRLLYAEQAGRIADPMIPTEDKLAALSTIRNIMNKYKMEAEVNQGEQKLGDMLTPNKPKANASTQKTTIKDGKTYYYWASDGNYHTKPPE